MRVVSFGAVLWDVLPRGIFLGGAPLNVAAHLSKLGAEVTMVSAENASTDIAATKVVNITPSSICRINPPLVRDVLPICTITINSEMFFYFSHNITP